MSTPPFPFASKVYTVVYHLICFFSTHFAIFLFAFDKMNKFRIVFDVAVVIVYIKYEEYENFNKDTCKKRKNVLEY